MDKRIVVSLDVWDADSMYPNGHYVRTLGEIGKVETETVSPCPGEMGRGSGGCPSLCTNGRMVVHIGGSARWTQRQ